MEGEVGSMMMEVDQDGMSRCDRACARAALMALSSNEPHDRRPLASCSRRPRTPVAVALLTP